MKFIFGLFAALAISSVALADITVTGQGAVNVTPDNAVINITVRTDHKNMRGAVTFNAEETQKIMTLLKDTFKIHDSDLCTHTFSVNPNHDHDKEGKITKVNFTAVNYLIITVRDTSKAGDILGSIGTLDKSNTININGINFVVSSTLRNSVLDQARKLAVRDACNRAKLYAREAGAKLGTVKNISEMGSHVPMYAGRTSFSAMSESTSVPVSAGTAQVMVNVSVTFNNE
jgi:uncharacterized protein YggE